MVGRVQRFALPYVAAYGQCFLRDVMPAFTNLEKRAEEVVEAEFQRLCSEPAYDDWDGDVASLAEAANDKGQAFYDTMAGMRQAALNLFAVGLFHLLEQQLAYLCRDGAFTVPPPGDSKLCEVVAWFRGHFNLDLRTLAAWSSIDELRLVANATKHAEGRSARQLREHRPELFISPFIVEKYPDAIERASWPIHLPLAGDDLAHHFETHSEEYYPEEGP